MKISFDWISDFVDLSDLEPKALAEQITLAIAEVEEVETLQRHLDGVVVGQVASVAPLSEAPGEKRTRVEVLTSANTTADSLVTVCGAPNVRQGLKVAVARPGAVVAGGKTIESAEVGGVISQGMLCSAAELGFGDAHEGLMELPADLPLGAPLSEHVGQQDTVIEIDNKSLTHRPDLWGHYGFAREIAAVLKRPLKPLDSVELKAFAGLPPVDIVVDDTEACPAYSALRFRAPKLAGRAAPLIMQARLLAVGARSLGFAVDVTNYVMLELGQPTHAFDGDKIDGIRVGRPESALDMVTLDGESRKLDGRDLVVWTGDKPAALAGVMGGQDTEVTDDTREYLLESANFHGPTIRRTATRLNLRSDASRRFEKNQPAVHVPLATARIVHLLQEAGVGVQATSNFSVCGDVAAPERSVNLPADFVAKRSGSNISEAQVGEVLTSLGFSVTPNPAKEGGGLRVDVPGHRVRQDIAIPEDLLEEVLRVHGYGQIDPVSPSLAVSVVPRNNSLRAQHKARRVLSQSFGFHEAQTYGWFDDRFLTSIGWDPARLCSSAIPLPLMRRGCGRRWCRTCWRWFLKPYPSRRFFILRVGLDLSAQWRDRCYRAASFGCRQLSGFSKRLSCRAFCRSQSGCRRPVQRLGLGREGVA